MRTPDDLESDLCEVEKGIQAFKRGVPRPDFSSLANRPMHSSSGPGVVDCLPFACAGGAEINSVAGSAVFGAVGSFSYVAFWAEARAAAREASGFEAGSFIYWRRRGPSQ